MADERIHQQLVDIILRNERRSRILFVAWVSICLILGFFTAYFGLESHQKSQKLEVALDSLEAYRDVVEISRKSLVETKDSLSKLLAKIEKEVETPALRAEIRKELTGTEAAGFVVYIQVRSSNGIKVSQAIQQELKQNGFSVPPAEHIKFDFVNRISFFHEEDAGMALKVFEAVKSVAGQLDIPFDEKALTPAIMKGVKAPVRQIEVWMNI